MTEKSLAAVLTQEKHFEMREFDLPEIADDAALLKLEACGICGSDIHGAERLGNGPKILGHENVGIVTHLGKAAAEKWKVKEGDRIALEEYVPCGACKWCRSNDFRFCDQTDRGGSLRYGTTPIDIWPSLWGGYSQYMYVHPTAVVHKVPNNIPPAHAAAFLPFSNGVEWAYGYGEVGLGDSILIRDARRLEVAKVLGADYTIDVETEDLVAKVKDYTGGDGVNVVVNVTGGGKRTVGEAIDVASKKCNIVLAAAGREMVNVGDFGRRKIVVKQANGHSFQAVELAIQFIASGKLPMEAISTHTFPISRAMEAIDAVAGRGAPGAIHVSILPEV
jgi:threonine dehydrogenase-like Zn-dependent dehydrogenase